MVGFRTHALRSLSFLTGFVLITILSVPLFAQQGGVDLPVEFFFGRWAQGVTLAGEGDWSDRYTPQWELGATYATEQFRIGLAGLTGSHMPSLSFHHVDGFSGQFIFRPISRFQIGIDQFTYQQDSLFQEDQYSHIYDDREHSSFVASSRISLTESIALTKPLAKQVYLGAAAVGAEQLLWTNMVSYRYDKSQETGMYDIWPREGRDSRKLWSFSSELLYGISNTVTLQAAFEAPFEKTTRRYEVYETPPIPPSATYYDWTEKRYNPEFRFRTLVLAGENVVVEAILEKQFERLTTEEDVTQDGVLQYSSEYEYRLKDSRTRVGFELSTTSTGSFDPGVVLDNYLGYYRGLLFAGQQRSSLSFYYESFSIWDDKYGGISLSHAFGEGNKLENGLEFGAKLSYNWARTVQLISYPYYGFERISRITLQGALGVRWRSFPYVAGEGPGWGRDQEIDVALGPMVPPGELCFDLLLTPFDWYAVHHEDGTGFFNLSDLESSSDLTISLLLQAGLFSDCNLSAEVSARIGDKSTAPSYLTARYADLTFGLEKRFAQAIEIGLATHMVLLKGDDDPAEVTLTVAGLFW